MEGPNTSSSSSSSLYSGFVALEEGRDMGEARDEALLCGLSDLLGGLSGTAAGPGDIGRFLPRVGEGLGP